MTSNSVEAEDFQKKQSIMTTIRSESWLEFKNLVDFDNQPSGYRVFKVTIFDGNTGERCSVEYANNDDERADMTAVSPGYFYECSWLSKIF